MIMKVAVMLLCTIEVSNGTPYTLYPIRHTLYPIPYTLYPIPMYALCTMPHAVRPMPHAVRPMRHMPYARMVCGVLNVTLSIGT